ncbi:MAG: hypothetical protein ACRYF7_16070 [Janthinobacterium lividum]
MSSYFIGILAAIQWKLLNPLRKEAIMHHALLSLVLLLRLSFGALALTLAMLTAAALGVPAFAADLVAQGMPMPLNWPAVLVECALALAAFFLHRPGPRLAVPARARAAAAR